jgi:hypothetical protein
MTYLDKLKRYGMLSPSLYKTIIGGVPVKIFKVILFPALVFFITIGTASAADVASLAKGKALFNDPKLGTTRKTCNSCHPGGKGLEEAAAKNNLENVINGCITMPLKGNALDPKSIEMQSLVLYVKSFSEKKPAATK